MEKSRVVAILDYWSQTALRPLHQFLFGVLRKIPQDVTFDQSAFVSKVAGWRGEVEYHSLDLSSATDRYPIAQICDVLEGAFTREFVSHWRNIMVGYPFWASTKALAGVKVRGASSRDPGFCRGEGVSAPFP